MYRKSKHHDDSEAKQNQRAFLNRTFFATRSILNENLAFPFHQIVSFIAGAPPRAHRDPQPTRRRRRGRNRIPRKDATHADRQRPQPSRGRQGRHRLGAAGRAAVKPDASIPTPPPPRVYQI